MTPPGACPSGFLSIIFFFKFSHENDAKIVPVREEVNARRARCTFKPAALVLDAGLALLAVDEPIKFIERVEEYSTDALNLHTICERIDVRVTVRHLWSQDKRPKKVAGGRRKRQ